MDHSKDLNLPKTVADAGLTDPRFEKVQGGIRLVPQPSDSPGDPLNWSLAKKITLTFVLCLAAFAGAVAPLSGQLNLAQQAKLYDKTSVQESYANSAALAGIVGGPFFFEPLACAFGRSFVIFWTLLGALGCQIWAALMTKHGEYIPFILSRLFAGFFGAVPTIIGPRILTDMFFLHQRGRAFTALHMMFLFGTIAGPTFSAFISANSYFPVEFWWTVGLLGGVVVLVFTFLEETAFNRDDLSMNSCYPKPFLQNRLATFVLKTRAMPRRDTSKIIKTAITPFIIGLCPVTIIMGIFTLISFGFYVGINTLLPVWLQRPEVEDGYGFTLKQSAAFTFCHWIGIIIVQVFGHWFNDSLPLAIARRQNGIWKPEDRLHSLWIPSLIINPIGLGIFGAALQYHLHYLVLALAVFLVTVGSLASVPVTVNYIVECFIDYPAEASIVIGAYRIVFGLTISFYINPWVAAVGVGWVYGMMAFFAVFSFCFVILLMWKGHIIRQWQLSSVGSSEDGDKVVEEVEKR
ncbi:hypothetical protein MMC20_005119 [Loxospora ochrophaea]|nr:hypothetical protein [Loxospora ochrophaea]